MDEEALPLPVRMGLWIYVLGLIAYMTFFWIASESVAHKPENIDRWKKWRFFVDAFVFAGSNENVEDGNYGVKIKRAIEWLVKGQPIRIICESDFIEALSAASKG